MGFFKKLINKHTLSLASNAIMPVLGMAILSLMARNLPEADFGDYIFFLVIFTLADTFRTGFLQTSLIKFYAGTSAERSANIAGSAWYVGLAIIFTFGIGNLLVYFFYFGTNPNMVIILKWFSIIFLSTLPTAIAGWILQAEERFDKLFLVQLINQGGFFAFILLLIILHKTNFQNVIYSYFLNNVISSLATTAFGWSRIKTIGSRSWASIKELAHFGKYSVGTSISSYLLRSSDTFIIKMMFPSALLAVYYIPQRLMEIFEIPLRAFIATALPVMSAAVHRDDKKYVSYIMKKYAGMLTIALIPIALASFLLADIVIGLLFGAQYQHSDAGNIFRIFMCFVMLLPIDRFFGITLDIIGKPHLNMIKVFIMLAVNVSADFAGIFIFHNLYGVAIASIFTFFAGAIFGYWALKKHLEFSIKDIFYLGYLELMELIGILYNKIRKKTPDKFNMELKNRNIIIFSQMQFDGRLESTNYIMAKHLAKDNYVYYVDRPFTWRDYVKFKDTPEFKIRKPHFFSPANSIIQTEIPNLKIVISPPVPSINMLPEGKLYRMALRINELIVAARLKRVIKKLDIKDYIYINSYNYTYPTFHNLIKPVLTVYHCVDPLIEAYQTKHGLISEDIVVKSVDLVICTSKELRNSKLKLNKNAYFIPNAANISHSQKALNTDLPVADILSGIPKPIIGYFGNIERRIDYNLLSKLLEQNPEKSFVFIGPVDVDYVEMPAFKQPNAYLKGAVTYAEMPAVLKGFDVAIIPFKKDEVSNSIFPLKLFEYLGSGRPAVSSDFNPDLEEFTDGTVEFCKTAEEFTDAINKALNDTPELQQKRLEVAAENTWEHRIIEIEKLLALNLENKYSGQI